MLLKTRSFLLQKEAWGELRDEVFSTCCSYWDLAHSYKCDEYQTAVCLRGGGEDEFFCFCLVNPISHILISYPEVTPRKKWAS